MKHPIDKAMGSLAFSQQLADHFNKPMIQPEEMAQQSPEVTQTPVTTPESPQQEQGIVQTIKDTLSPFMDKIIGLLTKQENEVKQVELKIDGQMTPVDNSNV